MSRQLSLVRRLLLPPSVLSPLGQRAFVLASPVRCSRHFSTPPPPPPRKSTNSPMVFTWKAVAGLLLVGAPLIYFLNKLKKDKLDEIERNRQRTLGKARIGGPWELTDHHGRRRSSADFHGQWTLLYFGFCHCPDVCPDELEKMVAAVDILDKTKNIPKVVPIFITVDPQRDTPDKIKAYLEEFSPKILGFTGSTEDIAKVTKTFRVYFSPGPKDEEDYIVDHTIIMYLVNPDGEFTDYFGQNKTAEEMAKNIIDKMERYKLLK